MNENMNGLVGILQQRRKIRFFPATAFTKAFNGEVGSVWKLANSRQAARADNPDIAARTVWLAFERRDAFEHARAG